MDYFYNWKKYYKKKIITTVVRSRFLKSKINFLLITFLTMMLQMHINIIFCYLFMIHPYVDFFIQIIITIVLGYYTNVFLNFVLLFEEKIYAIPRYFVNNYSEEKFRIWKRNFVLFLSGYFIIILFFYRLDKFEIILQIIQTTVSFLILEKIQAPYNDEKIKKCNETLRIYDPITESITYIKVYKKGEKLKTQ